MHSIPDDAKPDYTKLFEHLESLGIQVSQAASDWLEFEHGKLPAQIETKLDGVGDQFDKLIIDIYQLMKDVRQISSE
jgi:hypothetical protein